MSNNQSLDKELWSVWSMDTIQLPERQHHAFGNKMDERRVDKAKWKKSENERELPDGLTNVEYKQWKQMTDNRTTNPAIYFFKLQ